MGSLSVRMKVVLAAWLLALCEHRVAARFSNTTFHLGVLAPVTSVSQSFIAAAVAFDLDFRKNFEPELVAAYGEPIIKIPDLHPDLRIQPLIGTSDSRKEVAARTVLNWAAGLAPFPQVAGIVGGMSSSIAEQVATISNGFQLPQVSWGASGDELSDDVRYPYFSRTIVPDHVQGAAAWGWIEHFGIPAVAVCFSDDAFGRALFHSVMDVAGAGSDICKADTAGRTIHRISFPSMPDTPAFGQNATRSGLRSAKATGSRFIMLFMTALQGEFTLQVMESENMLYSGTHQILASQQSVESLLTSPMVGLTPSRGLPVGFQMLKPVMQGPLFADFAKLWAKMSPSNLYSPQAQKRYMLDDMLVALANASAPTLIESDFSSASTIDSMVPFLFDAAYTYVFAINALLRQGASYESIGGMNLVSELREVNFEGITGSVSYTATGERVGLQELLNVKSSNGGSTTDLQAIGNYDSTSKSFFITLPPTWAGDVENMTVPPSLLSCTSGFVLNPESHQCEPCSSSLGCSDNTDKEFAIGIYGPITSLSHQFLAMAILFDLDFRKHTEPGLRERFGEPLVKIPNMHPDLKIKVQLGTSDSRVSTAMQTVLDWFQGINGARQVVGIVGGYYSAVSGPVASISEVFQIPQIAFGSSSATLSDKSQYPWFSRTINPDSLMAAAIWSWMDHFEVPAMAVIYTREWYGQSLFRNVQDVSINKDQIQRIVGIGVTWMSQATYDHSVMREAVVNVENTGRKFLFWAGASGLATSFMHAMEEKGMLYATHQLMCSFYVGLSGDYIPSKGMPNGFMKFESANQGESFSQFMAMWGNMTLDDVYGAEQADRYMLDKFKVSLPDGRAGRITEEAFKAEPIATNTQMLDAAYTYVLAINSLLNENVPREEIRGSRLLEAVRAVTFESVTGPVSFDANGDRQGNYDFYNVITGDGGHYQRIGQWSSILQGFTFRGDGNVTWVGGLRSPKAPASLTACDPGTRWDDEAGLCVSCPPNFFSEGGNRGSARCEPCPAGEVGDAPSGSTGCVQCPVGTSRSQNEGACIECALGTYTDTTGSSACKVCEVGRYVTSTGMSYCERCGANQTSQALFTTMAKLTFESIDGNEKTEYSYLQGATTEDSCGCDRGARADGAGGCKSCGTGMICRGMDDVVIKEGFYAQAVAHNGELSIFQCFGDEERCVGGTPGSTCAPGRKQGTISCSECMDDMTPSSDGACMKCGGNDIIPFLLVAALLMAALVITYHFLATVNRATQSHALLLCAIAVGLLVTVTQQLGVVGMLSASYRDPLDALLGTLGLLALDIEVLRFNCVSSLGSLGVYLLKICQIVIYIAVIIVTHIFFVMVRHQGRFREQKHALIGAIGTVFMVFYIAVTSTVLEPLQCQEHPNGKWTVRAYPSVVCWEDNDHHVMLIVGVMAFVTVPLSYVVACVMVVAQLPQRMQQGDSEFLKAFSFLFIRFRQSQHGYIVVTMMRSLAFALVLVLPDVAVQMFILQAILLASVMAALHRMPWRLWLANVLDCMSGAVVLLIVCLCAFFVEDEDKDEHLLAAIAFCGVLLVIVMGPCVAMVGLYRKYFRGRKRFEFFLCHHKASAGAYTRLLKTHLLELKLQGGIFIDTDNLDNLDHLFNYVGNETNRLVVICTAEIFTRPWCVGEMCTAQLKHVPVVMVMLPGGELPDGDMIADIEDHLGSHGVEILIENGITIEIISKSLQAMMKIADRVDVPARTNQAVMQTLAEQLIHRSWAPITDKNGRTSLSVNPSPPCLTIYDRTNLDAAATAYLLLKLTTPVLTHASDRLPAPWHGGPVYNIGSTAVIMIICTNGVFEQEEVLQVILQMPNIAATFLPVICESSFRIPHKDLPALRNHTPPSISTAAISSLAQSVQQIFREIAITFDAQVMGDATLRIAAQEVAKRVLNPAASKSKAKSSDRASTIVNRLSSGSEKKTSSKPSRDGVAVANIEKATDSWDTPQQPNAKSHHTVEIDL